MTPRSSYLPSPARLTGRSVWLAVVALSLLGQGRAQASPDVQGVRNRALGNSARASATGTSAALANPAALAVQPLFEGQLMYELGLADRTHAMGAFVVDSLNNPRLAVGLGYLFYRGSPRISYATASDGEERELELSRLGHEAALPISVTVVRNLLALGVKPKFQYASLRYRNDEGVADDAAPKLKVFGLDLALTVVAGRFARVAVVAENLTGNQPPPFDGERALAIEGVDMAEGAAVDMAEVRRISNYPLTLAHGLAVYPLGSPRFNLNVDGLYDFTSYADQGRIRPVVGGGAELTLGPVPLRAGANWDARGRGDQDDRVFVSGGVGYKKNAGLGGLGVDVGVAVSQQVAGPNLATYLGVNVGLRMNPDR